MNKLLPVANHVGLYRDSFSGGIVAVDDDLYREHLNKKNQKKEQIKREKENIDKINNLEKRVEELETFIREFMQNGNR